MAYDPVHIVNSTVHHVAGKVTYPSGLCSDDRYYMPPRGSWTAGSRGFCLVSEISGSVSVGPQGDISVDASPYQSSGTSYSQFAVIELGDGKFAVIRRVTGAQDVPPEDYVEPTEKQK